MLPCDNVLESTYALLRDVGALSNPYRNGIDGLSTLSLARYASLDTYVGALSNLDPRHGLFTDLKVKLVNLVGLPANPGSYSASVLGQMSIYSDFMSGQIAGFPLAGLTPTVGNIPNIAIMGSIGVFSVMALAKGQKGIRSELCETNPADACQDMRNMFSVILGSLKEGITTVLGLITQLTDFVNMVAGTIQAIIDGITSFIQEVIASIVAEVEKIVAAIIKTIKQGLAKLLTFLVRDPCLAQVIEQIGTPALQLALASQIGL